MTIDHTTPTADLIGGLVEHAEYAAEYAQHYPAKATRERAAMAEHMNELTRRCDVAARYNALTQALFAVAQSETDGLISPPDSDEIECFIFIRVPDTRGVWHDETGEEIAAAVIRAAQGAQ